MKFLGIDYGTKRMGLSISDEAGRLAFPKEILANDEKIFANLEKVLELENVKEIVIGESLDFAGEPNKVAQDVESFIQKLEKFKLPIKKEKEFLTSVEARRYSEKDSKIDANAAALILQRYLDRINRLKHNL